MYQLPASKLAIKNQLHCVSLSKGWEDFIIHCIINDSNGFFFQHPNIHFFYIYRSVKNFSDFFLAYIHDTNMILLYYLRTWNRKKKQNKIILLLPSVLVYLFVFQNILYFMFVLKHPHHIKLSLKSNLF